MTAWIRILTAILLLSVSSIWASSSNDDERASKVAALLAWLETHPGFVSNVRIGTNQNGVRGMFATKHIPKASAVGRDLSLTDILASRLLWPV